MDKVRSSGFILSRVLLVLVGADMFRSIYRLGVILASRLGMYRVRYTVYIAVVSRLLGLLKHWESGVTVDLGSGVGFVARMVSKVSEAPVVAVDVRRYDKWNSSGGGGVDYLQADVRYLPLKSGGVYFVYALSLLEHVEGWEVVIKEVFRILRSPGLFIIQLPNLTYFVEPHTKFPLLGLMPGLLRRAITSSTKYPELQFSCTLRNVVKELNRTGFRVVGIIPHYHSDRLKLLKIAPSYFIVALKATSSKT